MAAISAATCKAPAGENSSIRPPPSSEVAATAPLNHSHCWLTKAALALWRWPFSTSNAPHSVLEIAMAIDVSSSANTIGPGVVTCVTQANADDRRQVRQQQVAAPPIAEQRQEIRDQAVERLDHPRHVQHRQRCGDLQRGPAVLRLEETGQRLPDDADLGLADALDGIDDGEEQHQLADAVGVGGAGHVAADCAGAAECAQGRSASAASGLAAGAWSLTGSSRPGVSWCPPEGVIATAATLSSASDVRTLRKIASLCSQ